MGPELVSDFWVFLIGLSGGASGEVLHWYGLRRRGRLPAYSSSPAYWGITLAMILVGALLAWLRFGNNGSALDVFVVGLGAPIILQKILGQMSAGEDGARGSNTNLKDFFLW